MLGCRFFTSLMVVSTAAIISFVPCHAAAQQTDLTVAGLPISMTTVDATDYDAGSVLLGTTTFTVVAGFGFFPRETSVQITCASPCPRSGAAALNALQWRRTDQATWTNLTTSFVDIDMVAYGWFGSGTWARTLEWRYLLDWTTTPPTPGTEFRIQYRLVVAPP